MPACGRDFLKAAKQRLTTAEFLLQHGYNLDAMYLGGYVVECSLKALILEVTPPGDREETLRKLSSGSRMHRTDVLAGELKIRGTDLPLEIAKRIRRSSWTTDLRYETGRSDTGETRAFLRTAQLVYQWVEGRLP